jgi:hypothetical protein
MSWFDYISEETVNWLLEEENPSVRYWALQDLKGKGPRSKPVKEAQESIMDSSCVKAILADQQPEGHWEKYDNMYLPKYRASTHNLLILAELGAKRTESIERAIEHLYQFQRNSGHFLTDIPKTEKGKNSVVKDGCCLDANILFYLIHFGYLKDPRTQHLIQFQIDYHSEDGGWLCRAYGIDKSKLFPVNCYMGGVKMFKALAKIPKDKRPKGLNEILEQETEIILENYVYRYMKNPDGSRNDKAGWKRFGFPLFYQSDALEVMDVLTSLGIHDYRMKDSIDLILAAQQEDGRWLLKNSYNGKMLCEIDEKHKPSKWITLRAARILKEYYG